MSWPEKTWQARCPPFIPNTCQQPRSPLRQHCGNNSTRIVSDMRHRNASGNLKRSRLNRP
eukprot:760226-Hanusia_phi.AAC.11